MEQVHKSTREPERGRSVVLELLLDNLRSVERAENVQDVSGRIAFAIFLSALGSEILTGGSGQKTALFSALTGIVGLFWAANKFRLGLRAKTIAKAIINNSADDPWVDTYIRVQYERRQTPPANYLSAVSRIEPLVWIIGTALVFLSLR